MDFSLERIRHPHPRSRIFRTLGWLGIGPRVKPIDKLQPKEPTSTIYAESYDSGLRRITDVEPLSGDDVVDFGHFYNLNE